MKKNKSYILSLIILCFTSLVFASCGGNDEMVKEEEIPKVALSISPLSLMFEADGGTKNFDITVDETIAWEIINNEDWITISLVSGKGNSSISVVTSANELEESRSSTIVVKTESKTLSLTISQQGKTVVTDLYPNYNTNPLEADITGMSSTAVQLAANIKLGWNIGNSLEAIGGETAWGNPKTTKALIDKVKESGFNAVRIPCSWNQYLVNSTTAEIKTEWLDRVKEVVQYCIDNDMYVIVNIHWDGGWLENNITVAKKEENNAKQKAFWEQIATHLRDFDEHLLFAGTNEPSVENATEMKVLNSYHQTFIEAVRATGGKNAYRTLVIQGPTTDIEKTNNLMNTLPVDSAEDRMMVEVHYYSPYNFCLMTKDESWGKMFYYWGVDFHSTTDIERNATYGEEAEIDRVFRLMKTQFVDKGIPVVLGEFGAIGRTSLAGDALALHLASRAYYLKYVVKQAKVNGMLPFYWDAGYIGDNSFTLFDRSNNTIHDQQALNALVEGSN